MFRMRYCPDQDSQRHSAPIIGLSRGPRTPSALLSALDSIRNLRNCHPSVQLGTGRLIRNLSILQLEICHRVRGS